ncbi:MAG: formylglycine-generating enzyme family protein [Hyphomonadaceae bacterium]|nr:formylglycine-generating enzyme family protein [Hyphomonadaceae bacterium]
MNAAVRACVAAVLLALAACAPHAGGASGEPVRVCSPAHAALRGQAGEMVWIPRGETTIGSVDNGGYPEEWPPRDVVVDGFWIDRSEVTNAQFAAFVAATYYVTVAERRLSAEDNPGLPPELLEPGAAVFSPPQEIDSLENVAQWWRFTPGANWRHPLGPESSIEGREDYPVVQVAFEDAQAYARWAGRELPTEEQWERAARGAQRTSLYIWGDDPHPNGQQRANSWQGLFPVQNTQEDGFRGVAPVGCFEPNDFGLYDMAGNVWEWTRSPYSTAPDRSGGDDAFMTIKGGSFLCAPNYCGRFRPAARQAGDTLLGTNHTGFRTVSNTPGPS